jgi:hypothetical protein
VTYGTSVKCNGMGHLASNCEMFFNGKAKMYFGGLNIYSFVIK